MSKLNSYILVSTVAESANLKLYTSMHCIYKWVGHYIDHWSKYHIVFPLVRKSAAEVGLDLQNLVFAYLGVPRIPHSDNGREFVNDIVHDVANS